MREKMISAVIALTSLNQPVLLFDLQQDPLENVNIANESPAIVERLTKALDSA